MNKLKPELEHALSCALNREYEAKYFYEALVIKFTGLNLPGFAKFFQGQAEEEQEHIRRIVHYCLNVRNFQPTLMSVVAPPVLPNSPLQCLSKALDKELFIAHSIMQLIDDSVKCSDKHLEGFLVDFVLDEQYRSITELTRHVDTLRDMGESFQSAWLYDKQLKVDH